MSVIKYFKGREIIDSRGVPALEVELFLENGISARGMVPSGASTGTFEALELRDKDPNYFFGKGLKKAIHNVEILSQVLKGQEVSQQKEIDQILLKQDGTPLKSRLGANTLLAISIACVRAAAKNKKQALYQSLSSQNTFKIPVPLMNVINGGCHGSNALDIQEFMLVPWGFETFRDSLRAGCEIFHQLKKDLQSKNLSTAVGDEGGFTPNLKSHQQAIELILSAIEKSSYSKQVSLALDCASSEFYKKDHYLFESKKIGSTDLVQIYKQWIQDYPIISIEDGLAEEDWSGWETLTKELGDKIQIVGDDIFVTQKSRLKKGIEKQIANSLLVKCNQVGTITETIEAMELAQKAGYSCVMSHRSGETEDDSIADFAVAWQAEQIKTGSLSRGERTAKYNRLLRIEEELGSACVFQGEAAFKQKLK